MSTATSRGWDHHRSDAEVGPLYLCSHHAAATERLSDHHTAQLARACPWCADPQKPEPQWTNGRMAETRHLSTPAVNLTA